MIDYHGLTYFDKSFTIFFMNDNEILTKVAENIRISRLKKKITQEKLAEMAGVTQKYISLIEKQKANPSIVITTRICIALNISLSDLLNDI